MARNIKARRKLSDLYVRGAEVRFDAEGGHEGPFETPLKADEVAVWVQPPSPLDREMAMREANAARARAALRVRRQDTNSEEFITAQAFVSEMSDATLIEYLIDYENDKRLNEAQRDVLSEDEWKDFEALRDALREYEERDPDEVKDDEEYKVLLEADDRFGEQVFERLRSLTDADREAYQLLQREELERRAMERRLELISAEVFMTEYQRQMCYYSVREVDDHDKLFFESARDWADQPEQVQEAISGVLAKFIQDAAEAKNSPRAADGSDTSAPPSEPETSESSIQEELSV